MKDIPVAPTPEDIRRFKGRQRLQILLLKQFPHGRTPQEQREWEKEK